MESPLASPLFPDHEAPDPSVTLPKAAAAASRAGIGPDEHHAAAVQSDATGLSLRRPVPSMDDVIRANRLAAVARVNPALARDLAQDPVAAAAAGEHADDIAKVSRALIATTPYELVDQLRGARISAGAIRDEIAPFVKPRVRDIWEAFEYGYNTQIELGELGYRMWRGEDPAPLMARVDWIERKWAGTEEASGLGYFFHRSAEQSPQWVKGQERAIAGGLSALGINRGANYLASKWAMRGATAAKAGPMAPLAGAVIVSRDAAAFGTGYAAGGAYRTFEMYTGSAFLEMSRLTDKDGNKIDPMLARALAATVGAINAPLGATQIANMGDMLGGRLLRGQAARRFGRAVLGNETARARLGQVASRFGKDITLQAASELGQEFVAGVGAEMAMLIDQSFGEADEARQNVFARAFDSSLKAAASSVVPGLWRAGKSAPSAIIQARQSAAIRAAHREIGEIAEGTGLKTKSPEILTRMLQSRGADSIMIIDGRDVQDMLRDKAVSEDLAKIGITQEMADESVTFGHGIRFHSASLLTNVRNETAQRVLDRSRLLGSRMLMEDATPEKVTALVREDSERAGNIAEHIDSYNRRLGLMQKQMTKAVEQSALLGRQVAAAGVKPSDYAAQVVRLVDGYAKRHALESGEDLNAVLARIVTKYSRRGEAPPAAQKHGRPSMSVSRRIGEGPTGHDILNDIAETGTMRRPGKNERGGEFDVITEGQIRLHGPYSGLMSADGMGADQMAHALETQGIGDGTVNTMWDLVEQALEARKQAKADAAEGGVTDLGEAEAAGLVRESESVEAADDVPFATDDLFEGLTEDDLAIGMRDMVDDLGTGMFGDDDVTMFQAADPTAAVMPDTISIDGTDRSTLNSNGQRIGRTEQEVRNFYNWFGDSKVVDDQGRPLVVYHGTKKKFDVFKDMPANKGNISALGKGHYFTRDKGVAEVFGRSMAVYIRAADPLTTSSADAGRLIRGLESVREVSQGEQDGIHKGIAAETKRPGAVEWDELRKLYSAFGTKAIRAAGYDALSFKGADEIVVFTDTQIKSTANRGTYDPSDPSIYYQSLGARVPTGKGRTENALTEQLLADLATVTRKPALVAKMRAKLEPLGAVVPVQGETDADFIARFVLNATHRLLALHDAVPESVRSRSRLWYDGAEKIADGWASDYGVSKSAAAGVLAVLSPQKDWYQNVDLARRVLDIVTNPARRVWDDGMLDRGLPLILGSARASLNAGKKTVTEKLAAEWKAMPANRRKKVSDKVKSDLWDAHMAAGLLAVEDSFRALAGRDWSDLSAKEKGRFIRLRDLADNSQAYRLVTPEGGFDATVKTASGAEAKVVWAGYDAIGKAVAIIEDPSIETISRSIGNEHKVRNFYNNIFDPNNRAGFVTIDTHAVAAALLRPLAGSDAPVSDNFGGVSDADSGISGTYAIYAEAYRLAAEARGLLPREMQSITWEAVRGLFSDTFKTKENKAAIAAVWQRYAAGGISHDQAIADASDMAGGVQPPTWYGIGPDARGDQGAGAAGDAGAVPGTGWSVRAAGRGDGTDAARGDSGAPRSLSDPSILRQGAGPRLAAVHNITAESLAFADSMGGLAVPSIGVLPAGQGIEGFGDITLLGGRELADPHRVPVFDSDAYTSRFPQPVYSKVKEKQADPLIASMKDDAARFDERGDLSTVFDALVNEGSPDLAVHRLMSSLFAPAQFLRERHGIDVAPVMRDKPVFAADILADDRFMSWMKSQDWDAYRHGGYEAGAELRRAAVDQAKAAWERVLPGEPDLVDTMMSAWAKDGEVVFVAMDKLIHGMQNFGVKEVDSWATRDVMREALEPHAAEFKQWVDDKVLPLVGEPRLEMGRKKVPYTLDNIVEVMTSGRGVRGQEKTMAFGEGAARAAASRQFRDVEQMREAATQEIRSEQEIEAGREQAKALLEKYREGVHQFYTETNWRGDIDTWGAMDASMRAVARWAKGAKTEANMRKALSAEKFRGVTPEIVGQAVEAGRAFLETPVPYFEAKPQRGVDLSEFRAAVIPADIPANARAILEKHGVQAFEHDGTAEGKQRALDAAQAAVPDTLFQSTGIHGAEGFEQRQRAFDEQPRGSMTIASDRYLIEVFENANMSTILHELGHVFLEETKSLIDGGLAGEQTQKDWTTLQEWMGGDWSAMTLEQKIKAHEKFARAFETYLMEGKAPSLALERPFSRFREWLLSVYRNAMGIEAEAGQELNVNDDIRGVMDRMIASEQAIQEARIVNGQTRASGQEYRHLNLTPEEQSELNELLDVAFEAGKSRLVQDRERDLPALIRQWRAEARKQIEASEEYQALHDVGLRGEGLNADDVRAMAGQEAVTDLRRRGVIAKAGQGMDPNAIAGRFGMEDGAAFIQMLRNTPPVNKAIAAAVQSRIQEYMSAIAIDEALIDTDAQAAAMDKIRDLIASRHERGKDAVKVRSEALRELARVRMRGMSLERVLDTAVFTGDYQRHTTEERNLLRKAAAKPGTVDRADTIGQALAAHDKAKLAMEMLRLAREIRGEVDAAMKTVQAAKEKPSKTRTAKGKPHRIGYQWRENILHLANRAGLVEEKLFVQSDREHLAAILVVEDPIHEMGPEFSEDLMSDSRDIPYLEMNIDEWRELSSLMEHLKHRGIQEVKDEVFRGAIEREALIGELQATLAEHRDLWTWNENNPLRKVVNFVDNLMAGRLQLLYILRAADGYTNLGMKRQAGPFETHLYDRIERAYDVEQRTVQAVRELLDPHMRQLEKSMLDRPHVLDLAVPFPAQGSPAGIQRNWTYERLVTVALNCGNRYQLDALARGYGWGEMVTVDDMTGRQEWRTDMDTINALLGSLTADDLKAVQGIWNSINSLWGSLSAVHKRRFGFAPVKVDSSPMTVTASDGTTVEMDGGYYPMMFDRSIDRRHEQQQAAEDLLVSNTNLLPTAKTYSGFMTERINSGGKPIRLDLGVLIEHIAHTAKYIAYTETMLDIAKVLGDGRFSNPTDGQFVQKFGANIYNQIMPALADTARVSREHKDVFDRIFDWARGNATRYMLGLNPQTAVRQLSATIPGIERVGAANYLAGLLRVASNPMEAVRYMREHSTVMRARWQSQDREVRDQIQSIKGRYGTLWRIGRKMGIPSGAVDAVVFGAVQVMDYITATPVWFAAYRRAVHDGMSHEDAILTANKDVVDTQSMARPFDLSAYQRSQKGYVRLFTSFMTFLMRSGNQAWLYDHGLVAGKIKGTTYARYFIINRIAQPLLELMLLDLAQGRLRGLLDGEEEDWKRYSFTALQWQFIGMPGVREAVDAAAYHTGGAGFRPKGLPSPSLVPWDLLNNLMRDTAAAMEDDTRYERALMSWAHMLSFSMGIPASRLYARLSEGLRQYDEEMDADLRNILWPNPDLRRRR